MECKADSEISCIFIGFWSNKLKYWHVLNGSRSVMLYFDIIIDNGVWGLIRQVINCGEYSSSFEKSTRPRTND